MRLIPLIILFLSFPIFSEEWKVGMDFPLQELEDQHENRKIIPEDTQKIFFLADMGASKILHPVLEEKETGFLEERKSVVISDIHRMPGLITKFVALPKMQGYKYTIHLIRDETTGTPFPREKDSITLIRLKKGKITKIEILKSEEELTKALFEK